MLKNEPSHQPKRSGTTVFFRAQPLADNFPFVKEEGNCKHLVSNQVNSQVTSIKSDYYMAIKHDKQGEEGQKHINSIDNK